VELSPKNEAAMRHYFECRAIGRFPDDEIVRRNAMIIRRLEDTANESRRDESEQRGLMMGLQLMRKSMGG
jgi:hypothetical protein